MRTNLITHFYCNKCGHQLLVEYDHEDSPEKIEVATQTSTEPTGGVCRYNKILVVPCQHCINVITKPTRMIMDGLRALSDNSSAT